MAVWEPSVCSSCYHLYFKCILTHPLFCLAKWYTTLAEVTVLPVPGGPYKNEKNWQIMKIIPSKGFAMTAAVAIPLLKKLHPLWIIRLNRNITWQYCKEYKYPNMVKLKQNPDYSAHPPVLKWRSRPVAKSAHQFICTSSSLGLEKAVYMLLYGFLLTSLSVWSYDPKLPQGQDCPA